MAISYAEPSPPRNIAVSRITNEPHTLFVSWTQPAVFNGLITNYTIYCDTTSGSNAIRTQQRSVAPTFTSMKFMGLMPFTAYQCAVAANTSAGESSRSSTAFATTDESGK